MIITHEIVCLIETFFAVEPKKIFSFIVCISSLTEIEKIRMKMYFIFPAIDYENLLVSKGYHEIPSNM